MRMATNFAHGLVADIRILYGLLKLVTTLNITSLRRDVIIGVLVGT